MTRTGETPGIGRPSGAGFLPRRAHVNPIVLMIGTALFILALDNATFWQKGFEVFPNHPGQFAVLVVVAFLVLLALMALFASRHLLQPVLAFLLILSAATSFYVDTMGVVFNREMIQNVVSTTYNESKHLITFSYVTSVFLWGVLPALVVFWFRLRPVKFWKALAVNTGLFALCIVLAVGLLYSNLKSYASVYRERKDFIASFQPGAPLAGTIRYVQLALRAKNVAVTPIGLDARKGPDLTGAPKPVLSIIVVGETERSRNYSLNGYGRETNPYTANLPVVSFSDVSSCGTATAVSLPCMFSKYDRSTYSYGKGIATENVLDVLQRAGVDVQWWDNNTGSKKVADRVLFKSYAGTENDEFCYTGECNDGIFLADIRELARTITEDTVLVLHLIGSHGPTYYLRYPPQFEVFTPPCRTADFQYCTQQEVLNSYDNSILYTDYILAQIIDLLGAQDNLISTLLYVSDHGESLGEGGLYLHGSPYMLAPDTQTRVPLITWMSQSFQRQFAIDQTCLRASAARAITHANLFHSILGLMDIRTAVRQAELDIFAGCRGRS